MPFNGAVISDLKKVQGTEAENLRAINFDKYIRESPLPL